MLFTALLRWIGFSLGSGLYLYLAYLITAKQRKGAVERLAAAGSALAALWHLANLVAATYLLLLEPGNATLLATLGWVWDAAAALAPALLIHSTLVLAGAALIWAVPLYGVAVFGLVALRSGQDHLYVWLLAACCLGAGGLLLWSSRSRFGADRRVLLAFAASLGVLALVQAAGPGSALVVLGSLGPGFVFLWFIYRYNFLGLMVPRRLLFALGAGLVSAAYLFLVRRLAGFAEARFDAFGPLLEVLLIFAAAGVWFPLYRWMTRSLNRRTSLYADFGRRLIHEAVAIFDLQHRLQYVAEQLGQAFGLKRVVLATAGEPQAMGTFGEGAALDRSIVAELQARLKSATEILNAQRTSDDGIRNLLDTAGFNYAFPLWYEERLSGFLFADTRPRLFLDETEPILAAIGSQIPHLIETHRLLDQKISLEKTLLEQEHLAALGTVAATIAHEVKNPLSSIKTLAQLMNEDPQMDQRYRRDLSYIIAETDRLNGCVQQLLTFSRPGAQKTGDCAVSEVIGNLSRTLQRENARRGLNVESVIQPDLVMHSSDRQALQQIVLNLALNALQASEQGATVRLHVSQNDGRIAISVTDQGPGIPAELQSRIFEPFFTTKQKGTGLGLAIVHKNVRQLGGEISVESPVENQRGSRFTVFLPVG